MKAAHLFSLSKINPPANSLLEKELKSGKYVDCFSTTVEGIVRLQDLMHAFYTSPAFAPERLLLSLMRFPSSDQALKSLINASSNNFLAWTVVDRADDQILLQDYQKMTSSWLCAQLDETTHTTHLYFGSSLTTENVNPSDSDPANNALNIPALYRIFLPFHEWYSRILLKSAALNLKRE